MSEYDRHFKLTETRDHEIVVFEEQYRSLRKEILDRQQRRFFIVAGAALGIPSVSGLKITGVMEGTFLYIVPLVVVAMSFLFVIEVNGIARAGRFIEKRIENQFKNVAGWEHFLKDLRATNDLTPSVVKVANSSFLILMAVYFVFSALVSASRLWYREVGDGGGFFEAAQTSGAFWSLTYSAFMLAAFFAWIYGMWPHLKFSAETHK
ncbi:hypothetical protein [Ruegeria profundi]|uniref:Uncharacterized protein n=1 Tax=Ruegeria profundi TaxID=1685378 RepID=A0A0X3TS48_9RHOB|nr:hypothetical protein [Ruegeria profundi]KUJ78542.1 hypothetical protein AVO44_12560 [Ruegeria profundi]